MSSQGRVIDVKDRLPPTGQWVIAVTPGFRCMACVDQQGQWREVARGEELQNVQAWWPADEPD
jgi:hypothetical protein